MDNYKRDAVFEYLGKFCLFAKKDDFIEVTKWKNDEGIDITLSTQKNNVISLTFGELKAIKKLSKQLDKGISE
jgi:hypothetical protein